MPGAGRKRRQIEESIPVVIDVSRVPHLPKHARVVSQSVPSGVDNAMSSPASSLRRSLALAATAIFGLACAVLAPRAPEAAPPTTTLLLQPSRLAGFTAINSWDSGVGAFPADTRGILRVRGKVDVKGGAVSGVAVLIDNRLIGVADVNPNGGAFYAGIDIQNNSLAAGQHVLLLKPVFPDGSQGTAEAALFNVLQTGGGGNALGPQVFYEIGRTQTPDGNPFNLTNATPFVEDSALFRNKYTFSNSGTFRLQGEALPSTAGRFVRALEAGYIDPATGNFIVGIENLGVAPVAAGQPLRFDVQWPLPGKSPFPDGVQAVVLRAIESDGVTDYRSPFLSRTILVDTAPPAPIPTLPTAVSRPNGMATELFVRGRTFVFSGTVSDPGAREANGDLRGANGGALPTGSGFTSSVEVEIFDRTGLPVNPERFLSSLTLPVDSDGRFLTQLTVPSDGEYRITTRASDFAGNTSSPVELRFQVDGTVPTFTINKPKEGVNAVTANTDIEFEVAENNLLLDTTTNNPATTNYQIQNASGANVLGTLPALTTTDLGGVPRRTRLTASVNLPEGGEYNLIATVIDKASNVAAITRKFSVDKSDPTVTGLTLAANPATGKKATTGEIYAGGMSITATAQDGLALSKVELVVDGIVVQSTDRLANNTLLRDTTGPQSITFNLDTKTLLDGSHKVRIRATDGAARTGESTESTYEVDNAAPVITILAPNTGELIRGDGAAEKILFTVREKNVDNTKVVVTVGGATVAATADPIAGDVTTFHVTASLAEGLNRSVVVNAEDLLGNRTSPPAGRIIDIDNAAPASSILAIEKGAAATDNLVARVDQPDLVRGNLTVRARVTDSLRLSGAELLVDGASRASVTATGTSQDVTFPLDTRTLSEGVHDVRVRAIDAANRTTDSDPARRIDVDNTVPTITVLLPVPNSVVRGEGADIKVRIRVRERNLDRTKVTVNVDGANVPLTVEGTAGDDTTFTGSSVLVEKAAALLTASAEDSVGNKSADERVTFDVDTTAPVSARPTLAVGGPTGRLLTTTVPNLVRGPLAISGRTTDNIRMRSAELLVDGASRENRTVTGTGGDVTFTLETGTLSDGVHSLVILATDSAGRSTASATVTIQTDNTLPVINIVSPSPGAILLGDNPTSEKVRVNVTDANLTEVRVTAGGQTFVATPATSPTGFPVAVVRQANVSTVTISGPLTTEGEGLTLTIQATDALDSVATDTRLYTSDRADPTSLRPTVAPVAGAANVVSGPVSGDPALRVVRGGVLISGDVRDTLRLVLAELLVGGTVVQQIPISDAGRLGGPIPFGALDTNTLQDGTAQAVQIRATDSAGRTFTSAALTLVPDRTAPRFNSARLLPRAGGPIDPVEVNQPLPFDGTRQSRPEGSTGFQIQEVITAGRSVFEKVIFGNVRIAVNETLFEAFTVATNSPVARFEKSDLNGVYTPFEAGINVDTHTRVPAAVRLDTATREIVIDNVYLPVNAIFGVRLRVGLLDLATNGSVNLDSPGAIFQVITNSQIPSADRFALIATRTVRRAKVLGRVHLGIGPPLFGDEEAAFTPTTGIRRTQEGLLRVLGNTSIPISFRLLDDPMGEERIDLSNVRVEIVELRAGQDPRVVDTFRQADLKADDPEGVTPRDTSTLTAAGTIVNAGDRLRFTVRISPGKYRRGATYAVRVRAFEDTSQAVGVDQDSAALRTAAGFMVDFR